MIMNKLDNSQRLKGKLWFMAFVILIGAMAWLIVSASGQQVARSKVYPHGTAKSQADIVSPQPPITVPLPEEVTGLHRVAFIESHKKSAAFVVQAQSASAEGNLTHTSVSIPGLTFKATHARRGKDWVYLIDRFEIDRDGQTFYASGSFLIRTIAGGVVSDNDETTIECWQTSSGAIYKNPARAGTRLSFADVLSN